MGISKIGFKLIEKTAAFVKASGKTSILQTKAPVFHGINPSVTYPAAGKTITLPRFISEEMKEARKLNKIAINQSKTPIDRTFAKATPEDLKRLTDTSFEASRKRAVYTSLKDGSVYHLLAEGKTPEGPVKVRILDKDGAFVKAAEIRPRKIVILDNFDTKKMTGCSSSQYPEASHGTMIKTLSQSINPFADYEFIPLNGHTAGTGYPSLYEELAKLQKRIDSGEKIDFISLSIARHCSFKTLKEQLAMINCTSLKEAKITDILNNNEIFEKFPLGEFARRNRGKVRIIQGAGNAGKTKINADLTYPDIEGCGALAADGKIAGFSASRNTLFTQHYEPGCYKYTPTEHGLSLFGGYSTEIPIVPSLKKTARRYIGTKPVLTSQEENVTISGLRKSAVKKMQEDMAKIRKEVVTESEEQELKSLYDLARQERNNKTGAGLLQKYKDLAEKLQSRVTARMQGYSNEYQTKYEEAVKKLIEDGKVMSNGFSGEYMLPNPNPYKAEHLLDFETDKSGILQFMVPRTDFSGIIGTSFSTPVRTAKLALNEMLKDVI